MILLVVLLLSGPGCCKIHPQGLFVVVWVPAPFDVGSIGRGFLFLALNGLAPLDALLVLRFGLW